MSTRRETRCDGCDKTIAAGEKFLGMSVSEEREDVTPRPPRRRRRGRFGLDLGHDLRTDVCLDLCGDCAARVKLSELVDRIVPPLPETALTIGCRVRATRAESTYLRSVKGRIVDFTEDDDAIVELDEDVSVDIDRDHAPMLRRGERVVFRLSSIDRIDEEAS